MAGRFEGKQALVLGVANKRSIAWAIARRLAEEGYQIAFTYQGERIEKSVRELAESVSSPLVTECELRTREKYGRTYCVLTIDSDARGPGGELRLVATDAGDATVLDGWTSDDTRLRIEAALAALTGR